MHLSLHLALLFAFGATLVSTAYFPRSETDASKAGARNDGYKLEEYGGSPRTYSSMKQSPHDISPEDLAQIRRQYQQHRQQQTRKQQQRQKDSFQALSPKQSQASQQSLNLQGRAQAPKRKAASPPAAAPKGSKETSAASTKAASAPATPTNCKSVADCKCPNPHVTNSCFKYKCICGDKKTEKIADAFIVPIAQGLKKVGDGIDLVLNDVAWGVKEALRIGSWMIPGLGKTAMKALDAIIPDTHLKTGNAKADEIINTISKAI